MKQKIQIWFLCIVTLSLLLSSGVAASQNSAVPDDSQLSSDQSSYTKRIEIDSETHVDMKVEGNVTTLMFSDGSMVIVRSYSANSSIDIYENMDSDTFSRFHYSPTIPTTPALLEMDGASLPDTAAGLRYQEINRSTGSEVVQTELHQLSLGSPDSIEEPSITQLYGDVPTNSSSANDTFFRMTTAFNGSHTEFDFFSGVEPTFSNPDPVGTNMHGFYTPAENTGDFGSLDFNILDRSPGETLNSSGTFHHNTSDTLGYDSFFDVFFDLTLSNGDTNQHEFQGRTSGDKSGSEPGSILSWNNLTTGTTESNFGEVAETAPPIGDRWGSPSDVTDPWSFIDVTITDDSVSFEFDDFSFMIYVDKAIINYLTDSGYYLPIIVYFITLEVHIVYEFITIIVYLEIIELIFVIIIYEIIKIEIYIDIIVILIEISITIIEIVIHIITIEIIQIIINFIINVFVFKLIININIIVVKVFPVRILIVPVFIPIFFPVFVPIPIFIPVPTPVPYVLPRTDVDLHAQYLNKPDNNMTLEYNVTNEYDHPLSGVNVTVWIDDGSSVMTYSATEDPLRPGIYSVDNATYSPDARIIVRADPPYRPDGMLNYTQEVIAPTTTTQVNSTVVSTTNNTVTTTVNNTVTTGGLSSVPVSTTAVIFGLVSMAVIPILRKRTK